MKSFDFAEQIKKAQTAGKDALEFLRVPALSLSTYHLAAGGPDPQQPHTEDEVYYVIRGRARFKAGEKPISNLLAISGGADDGAFGAGLLVGWSEHGNRPEFDLVTGISAGALIAPFAFLGREFDTQLAGLFTSYDADQIYKSNVLTGLFGSIGHYLIIEAHRLAPASAIAPFNYLQIVFMAALGALVFDQWPNAPTLAGAAIVVSSGLYLLYRERKVRGA